MDQGERHRAGWIALGGRSPRWRIGASLLGATTGSRAADSLPLIPTPAEPTMPPAWGRGAMNWRMGPRLLALALVSCASVNFYAPCGDCQDEATCAIRRAFSILRDQSTAVLDSISLAQGSQWEERLGTEK